MLDILNKECKKSTIVFIGTNETLTTYNLDGLFAIANKYNAILRMNIYRPVANDKRINDRFILSYNNLINAINYIYTNYEIIALNDSLLSSLFTGETSLDSTGINSLRILPDGSITPSTYLINKKYRDKYNIKQINVLKKIKYEEFQNIIIPKECNNCSLFNICKGGVVDRRLLWYGTLKERDPYCPTRNNDNIFAKNYIQKKEERISVHDGYLPTLFFKNKGG